MTGKHSLAIIILILGPCVLISYYFALKSNVHGIDALWGNMPDRLKALYPIGMVVATFGFLPFGYYSTFKSPSPAKYIPGFLLILIPSIIWLPLTVSYLNEASSLKWQLIRVVLFIVPLGASLVYWKLKAEHDDSFLKRLSIIALVGFILHTLILDAIVWPRYFHLLQF